jgi:hypothetical protein
MEKYCLVHLHYTSDSRLLCSDNILRDHGPQEPRRSDSSRSAFWAFQIRLRLCAVHSQQKWKFRNKSTVRVRAAFVYEQRGHRGDPKAGVGVEAEVFD